MHGNGYGTTSRCRAVREGKISRRRTYMCRKCGEGFRVDTMAPVPVKERICPTCELHPVEWCRVMFHRYNVARTYTIKNRIAVN